jgi:hypothetical protein
LPRPGLRLEELEDRRLPSTLQVISAPVGSGTGPAIGAGNDFSTTASISADGRYIAYESNASNLVVGQVTTTIGSNVFLLDQTTGATSLVSHATASPTITAQNAPGGFGFNPGSAGAIISSDGNFVTFTSDASNLVNGLTNSNGPDVYVWNRQTGGVALVSHTPGNATNACTGTAQAEAISSDGRFILYSSDAPDLVAGQTNPGGGTVNQFLYDQNTGQSVLVSHAASSLTTATAGTTSNGVMSADGSMVAYTATGSDLVSGLSVSANTSNVFLSSSSTGASILLSGAGGSATTGGNGSSFTPVISGDGSTVAFVSQATNLITNQGHPTGADNVFRYQGGTLALVSHAAGAPTTLASGDSAFPVINANGTVISFQSTATNLVPNQTSSNAAVRPTFNEFAVSGNVFAFAASQPNVALVSGVNGSATLTTDAVPFVIYPPTSPPQTSISDDGRFIAYRSQANNVISGQTGPGMTDNIFVYDRSQGTTVLASSALGVSTTTANAPSRNPVISGQGGFVAFDSLGTNLNANTTVTNGVSNVWVYNLSSPGTSLVSHSTANTPGAGAVSTVTSVSADGNFSVFQSTATNLIPGQTDNNFNTDVFLHNNQTNTTFLVSHIPGSTTTTGDFGASQGVISKDGNFIAFTSDNTNLVPGQSSVDPTAHDTNIFLYNVQTGVISLVSHAPGSTTTDFGTVAFNPVISANGQYVAFFAYFGQGIEVFLADTIGGTVTLVSHTPGSTSMAGGIASSASLSDDGLFLAYAYGPGFSGSAVQVAGSSTTTPEIYLWNRSTGNNTLVSHAASSASSDGNQSSQTPVVSGDGSYVAYASFSSNLVSGQSGPAFGNVFLYNIATGLNTLVSHVNGSTVQGGMGDSDSPAIDSDGSFIAFRSEAVDIGPGQSTNESNIYEFNLQSGAITLVSYAAGAPTTVANGASSEPVIDSNGTLVAYQSTATNLVPGQSGPAGVTNIFVWDQVTGNTVLASGQGGSYTVGGNASSFNPVISQNSFPYFSSMASNLVTGTVGTTNAFVNTIVQAQVTLSPITVPNGATAGTVVGTFTITIVQGPPGQLRLPTITLDPAGADSGAFSVTQATVSAPGALVLQVTVNAAVKGTYSIVVDVDLGFGDLLVNPFTLSVTPTPTPTPIPTPTPTPTPAASGIGAFDSASGTWYLRNELNAGAPDAGQFAYGLPNWEGVVGDWNGDSTTTVGVVDPTGLVSLGGIVYPTADAFWYLRNENSAGGADVTALPFAFGFANWIPIAGDWTGSGHTGIGMVDPSSNTFYLENTPGSGKVDFQFQYGAPGWIPVAGDWNHTGHAGIGMVDPTTMTWYLRNEVGPGAPDAGQFAFGFPGWQPVVGDWNGDGTTTVGVFAPQTATWYLRNENSSGAPDAAAPFAYGFATWKPVAGAWTGPAASRASPASAPGVSTNEDLLAAAVEGLIGKQREQALDAIFST